MVILLAAAVLPVTADVPLPDDIPPVAVYRYADHPPVEIVRDGQPRAVVYLAVTQPSANLKRVMGEFASVIKLSTGAELPVVTEPPAADAPAIIIGDCDESRKAGINSDEIPVEGFVVRTAPNRVYLVGSTHPIPATQGHTGPYANDGTAWAVADFLERYVGARWYWPTEVGGRCIAKNPSLVVPPGHYVDQPVFRKREFFPPSYSKPWRSKWNEKEAPVASEVAFPPQLEKIEMQPFLACVRSGSSWPYMIKVHQPQNFANNPQQWESRKAMFQKNKDGSPNYRMLCYSSQETLDYLLQGCEDAWSGKKPFAAVPWVTTTCVTVSPGDYPVRCACEQCEKLFEPDKAPYGTSSRVMGLFVKKMCDEVNRRWPGKKVLYLPYWNYTMCPDDIDYPGNLEIEMCTMAFGLMRQPDARKMMQDAQRAWSRKVGGRITTWEYPHRVPEWTHAPVQYPHLVQEYYRGNRDVLAGSFLNGGGISEWSTGAPTNCCLMRLLWNPDTNVDAMLDGLCDRMFGKAASTTREMLHLMCDRWEKSQWSQGLGDAGQITPPVFSDTWPPDVVAKLEKLWRRAREELKDDPAGQQRFEYWTWTFEPFLKEAKENRAKAGRKTEQ